MGFYTVLFMLTGYLAGSIPTGYLVARLRGIDIQSAGSGNIGATNVLRTMGVIPAIIVVLIDPLKAFLAVGLPVVLGMSPWVVALTGVAVVLGNTYNVFLKFKGGRGVATSLGAFAPVDPITTLATAILGIITIGLGRFVSLGSLVGVLSAPIVLLARGNFELPHLYLVLFIAFLITYRHRDNIDRLAKGIERRLGEKKEANE